MILESLSHDLRLACRGLLRAKGFAITAILTLALGIAGTTVMYSLIQGVLLRPLPVAEQDRLVVAWKEVRTSGSAQYPFDRAEIDTVAKASRLLENAAGVARHGVGRSVLVENGVASYVNDGVVTGGFFDVLGIRPILGAALSPALDVIGAENALVISHRLWRQRYGASHDVIGRRVTLSEQPFTIIGVMPPDVDYPSGVEVWRTTSSVPTTGPFGDAAQQELNLLGRLRPGVVIEQVAGELTALSTKLHADAPGNALRGLRPVVHRFEDIVVGDVRTAMLALFVAVGVVLLISSANVTNLLLMRGEGRRAELALRAALGGSRTRIALQLLAESVMLGATAGVAGFAVAWWSLPTLIALIPGGLPRAESVRIDGTVLMFTVGVTVVTVVFAGLAPALLAVKTDLAAGLTAGGRRFTGASSRVRRTLVVAQVSLAVTIVAAAGLLIRSVLDLQSVDLGMAADRLVLLELEMPQTQYADASWRARFLDAAISQLESVPAVRAATPVNVRPFTEQGWDLPRFTADGQSAERAATNPSLNLESIHPNYFETLEVAVVRGRAFTAADKQGSLEVAIVSEDVANRIWPAEDPIGKRLKMGRADSTGHWSTIVGVAAQTRYRDLRAARPTLYLPAAQFQMTAGMMVVRTAAPLELVASLSRERIRAIDPGVNVMRVSPFGEMLNAPMARPRFNAFVLGVFGISALLLSTIGLYAVMSAHVRQRHREIALRVALGATPATVCRFVIGEALRLAGVGALVGLAGAAATTPLLRGMLFDVHSLDPVTLLGAAVLLIIGSALASYMPVRRAARVDPIIALRSE